MNESFSHIKAGKISLIRSSPMENFKSTLELLRKKFPRAEVMFLTQPEVRSEVESMAKKGNRILLLPEGMFSLKKISEALREKVKKFSPDLFVIPYNNSNGDGYEEIEDFAFQCNPKWVVCINTNQEIFLAKDKSELFQKRRGNALIAPKFGYVAVEVTNICNLKCVMCNYRADAPNYIRPRGFIEVSLFKKIVDELAELNCGMLANYDGEPLMHPKFLEMLKYASLKNLPSIHFNTNGTLFNKKFSDSLVEFYSGSVYFSLDGLRETHNRIRKGSDYDKVVNNLEYLLERREKEGNSKMKIGVNCCKVDQTPEEIEDFVSMWLPKVDCIAVCETIDFQGRIVTKQTHVPKVKERPSCQILWSTFGITWNGDVVPCCIYIDHAKVGDGVVGNVLHDSLLNVWNNEDFKQFRLRQIEKKFKATPCEFCERWQSYEIVEIDENEKREEVKIIANGITTYYYNQKN